MRLVFAAELQVLPLTVFALVLAVTLGVTYWASKRTSTATEFWAAGRGVTGLQNGFAIAGDYMSASSFLGFAGLIFLFGVDGFVGLVAALVAFLPVLLFMAERMRNAGKYTVADVLSFRLRERPARVAAAFGTLAVVFVYLIAQMVGGGVLIQALTGIAFTPAVIGVGAFMLIYVIFGGMLATTWVQIIKAGLLMTCGVVITLLVLGKVGFNLSELFSRAAGEHSEGAAYLQHGLQFDSSVGLVSFGLAFLLGTAGLPHILMRFFTVPDAKAARGSVAWAVFLIGSFYVMVMIIGLGARALLGSAGEEAAGSTGNLAVPNLALELGGGEGSAGRRDLPGDRRGGRAGDDPRGRGRPGDLRLGRDGARPVVERGPQGPRVGARGGRRGEGRGCRDRHRGDRRRRRRRRGLQRLRAGRPGVRGRGKCELPGDPARAVLAAVQHRRSGDRHRVRAALVAGVHRHEPGGVARSRTARPDRRSARGGWRTRRSTASRSGSSAAGSARCSALRSRASGPTTS